VDVDPSELATRQLGIDEIASAINAANANRPTGTLYGAERNLVLQTKGQLMDATGFRQVVIAYRNGSPIRLDEVANVYDGVENDKTASWSNGTPAIYLAIQRQPGTNTVEVVDGIRSMLPQLQQSLPGALTLTIRSDRSESIRES